MFVYRGYLDDEGEVWALRVRSPGVEPWNQSVPLGGDVVSASVWKNRKAYGRRPRTAFLRRFDGSEQRFIVTSVPIYRPDSFDSLVIGTDYDWQSLTWQLIATRVELLL